MRASLYGSLNTWPLLCTWVLVVVERRRFQDWCSLNAHVGQSLAHVTLNPDRFHLSKWATDRSSTARDRKQMMQQEWRAVPSLVAVEKQRWLLTLSSAKGFQSCHTLSSPFPVSFTTDPTFPFLLRPPPRLVVFSPLCPLPHSAC